MIPSVLRSILQQQSPMLDSDEKILGLTPTIRQEKALAPQNNAQEDLQEYLLRSRNSGFVPSFSNRPEVLEADAGKTFGVGVRRTPAGKWEKVQQEANATNPISPAAQAKADIPSTGIASVDYVARLRLEKAELEQARDMQIAQAGSEFSGPINSLTNSLSILQRGATLRGSRGEQYAADAQATAQSLAQTQAARNEKLTQLKMDPQYQSIEAGIAQKEQEILVGQKKADYDWSIKQAEDATRARLGVQSDAARDEAIKAVPDATAAALQKVEGLPDTYAAKEQWALQREDMDLALQEVVTDIARNSSNPDLATPAMNLDKPSDQLLWYNKGYLNSGDRTDGKALEAKDVMVSAMNEAHKKIQKGVGEEYKRNDTLLALDDDIQEASGGTDSTRAALGYDTKLVQRDSLRQQVAAEYAQSRVVAGLKNTLLDTNGDLVSVPSGLTAGQSPIAQKVVETLKLPQFKSLQEAMDYFYRVEMPQLVEGGYDSFVVQSVTQSVLEGYMNKVNARHYASGVTIGPADLPKMSHPFSFSGALSSTSGFTPRGGY